MNLLTVEYLVSLYETPHPSVDDQSLPGLMAIAWETLSHAYGSAGNVPALLRAILSTDEQHRAFALTLLHQTIWHQGTIYQATSYAVPFLVSLLDHVSPPERVRILSLLKHIAHGHPSVVEQDSWQREWYTEHGQDFDTAVREAGADVQRARTAVRHGLRHYSALFATPDPYTRRCIAPLLCSFPEDAEFVVAVLHAQLRLETDAQVKAELRKHLVKLVPS
jgi:hypothetical protein